MKCVTARAIELMCPGVPVTACAIIRPVVSNTPAEMSPASRVEVLKAGAHQSLRLLLDDGDQAIPHDLQVNLRERAGTFHGISSASARCNRSR